MFAHFILIITKPKISYLGKKNYQSDGGVCVPFSPPRWFWRPNYQPVSDSILSAAPLCSAWIWESLRKQCKIPAKTCLHYFQIGYGLITRTLVLFQCNQPADGKYQSKVLEEGTSKDFGSQDKSFPEGTFWINLVRSSQQSFSLRIFPPKKKICKYSANVVAWGWKRWKFLRVLYL